MTWGIIPAAGVGCRIQPLAFSKELLPVGSRIDDGIERPRGQRVPDRTHDDRADQGRHHPVLRRRPTYIGTLVNAWFARGGIAWAARRGSAYVDVGTLHGWRDAVRLLDGRATEGRHVPPYRSAIYRR